MALVKCPNCGREISDKAMMCPNCGASIGRIEKMQFVLDRQPRTLKIIIGIIMAIGGVASLLPIFVNEPFGISGYGDLWYKQKTPEFCITIGVAAFGVLNPLCMVTYILVQRIRQKATLWMYWLISLAIAVIAPFSSYYLNIYAREAFAELYAQKLSAAEGPYRVEAEDVTMTISLMDGGDVLRNGEEGKNSNIFYDYATDRFFEVRRNGKTYGNWYDADMKFVETSIGKLPPKENMSFCDKPQVQQTPLRGVRIAILRRVREPQTRPQIVGMFMQT